MNEPTQEEIKEFWKWCGFKIEDKAHQEGGMPIYMGTHSKENVWVILVVDLNNLFKWAETPIIFKVGSAGWLHILNKWVQQVAMEGADPALALFWAIYKVIKEV